MAQHLSFFLHPSGSREKDIARGLQWLCEMSAKYPGKPLLLAVNDVHAFDTLIQPVIHRSWDDIGRNRHTISLSLNEIPNGVRVDIATERTIHRREYHVVLMVFPTSMFLDKL